MGGRRASQVVPLAVIGTVVAALSSCGFLDDLASPDQPADRSTLPSVTQQAAPPPPAAPRVVAALSIRDGRAVGGGPWDGGITVTVDPARAGLPAELGTSFGADCGRAEGHARYVAIDITFDNRGVSVASLAAELSVVDGPGAGDRSGEVGIFLESSDPSVRYCQDGDTAPSTGHFALALGGTVTAFLLTDAPGPPDEALGDLILRLTDLRNTAYSAPELVTVGEWAVQGLAVGAACPDEPDSVCALLG